MITMGISFVIRVFIIFSFEMFSPAAPGLPWEFSGLEGCSEALTEIVSKARVSVYNCNRFLAPFPRRDGN